MEENQPREFPRESWPRFSIKDDVIGWLPITYCHYWDFARTFSVIVEGQAYIFDSPFLEKEDDYADYFDVYKIGSETPVDSPKDWGLSKLKPRCRVPVFDVMLDETRKSFIQASIFTKIEET